MILGIIPARGGSKRIPRKNIKSIAGKPLIAWSIEAARKSKRLDKFVVCTEDKKIAKISYGFGAEVIPRPPELATDDAPLLGTFQHILKQIPATTIVLLQATSPIRNDGTIDKCINQFFHTRVDTVVTGFVCKHEEYSVNVTPRAQDVKGFFLADGNVYVIDTKLIEKGKIYSNNYGKVFTTREEQIDIDEPFDFWLAEQVLLKRGGGNSKNK